MKPLCCSSDHPPARVSKLIDHTTGTWRRDQLEEHFISINMESLRVCLCILGTRMISGPRVMRRPAYFQYAQRVACWYTIGKVDRTGSSIHLGSRTQELRKMSGVWNVHVPSKLRVFCGDSLNSLFPSEMYANTKIWPQIVIVQFAGYLILEAFTVGL
jgi:hypothetical protein